jgi:hypothetical protein
LLIVRRTGHGALQEVSAAVGSVAAGIRRTTATIHVAWIRGATAVSPTRWVSTTTAAAGAPAGLSLFLTPLHQAIRIGAVVALSTLEHGLSDLTMLRSHGG